MVNTKEDQKHKMIERLQNEFIKMPHFQNYNTPILLFKLWNKEFNFKLDPCTTSDNPLGTPFFYTPNEDGLKQDWINSTFYNPPYKETALWLRKAYFERIKGVTSVGLLRDASDTNWFHTFVYDTTKNKFREHVKTRYIRGRLKFRDVDGNYNATFFPSLLVIMYNDNDWLNISK